MFPDGLVEFEAEKPFPSVDIGKWGPACFTRARGRGAQSSWLPTAAPTKKILPRRRCSGWIAVRWPMPDQILESGYRQILKMQ
jgi:hypothetical protein